MSNDVENQRITIVPTESRRHRDRDSVILMTRRTLSIRAPTVPPSARLPIEYRTLSLHLEHSKKSDQNSNGKASKNAAKGRSSPTRRSDKSANSLPILPVTLDLSELDWHRVSIDEALRRLAVAPKTGLDAAQAQRRTARYGANQISPPPKRVLRKVIGWVFGGFGSLLLGASVVCFLAWYDTPSRPSFFLNGISNGSHLPCVFEPAGSRWGTRTRRHLILPSLSFFLSSLSFKQPSTRGRTFRHRVSWLPSRVCSPLT
jgi:hypothetical protein